MSGSLFRGGTRPDRRGFRPICPVRPAAAIVETPVLPLSESKSNLWFVRWHRGGPAPLPPPARIHIRLPLTQPAARRTLARTLTLLVLALPAAHRAAAQEHAPRERLLWAGAGALFAGSVLLDRTIEGQIPEGGGTRWEWASDRLNYGGRPQLAAIALGATWLGGRLAGSRATSRAAEHVGIALLASGVANGALKYGVGRERPSFTDDPERFRPLNAKDRWQSFPSGHAVVAFSLAASISEEARRPWVTAATYGTAALVGWSRVYEDRHWTSDVVAGAIVGAATSRWTVHRLHARRAPAGGAPAAPSVALTPLPGGIAIRIMR